MLNRTHGLGYIRDPPHPRNGECFAHETVDNELPESSLYRTLTISSCVFSNSVKRGVTLPRTKEFEFSPEGYFWKEGLRAAARLPEKEELPTSS